MKKKLFITNGEGEFDQDVLTFNNNFKTEYEQLSWGVQWRPLCNGFNQEYDNNNKRKSIFNDITIHNFNKGYGWNYLNSPFAVT